MGTEKGEKNEKKKKQTKKLFCFLAHLPCQHHPSVLSPPPSPVLLVMIVSFNLNR